MKRLPMVLVTVVMTLAACGGSSTTSTTTGGPSKVDSIAGAVPASVKDLAPLQIATDATYAPNDSINPDSGAIEGCDIEFGKAICKVMGVACTFNNVIFANIIPQLKAENPRYLFALSSYTPTDERIKGGIDFITYYKAGESWVVKAQGGPTIGTAADMCGHTVAVETGTTEEGDAWGLMGKQVGGTAIAGDKNNCPAGKEIKVSSFDKQTDANSALLSGRADILWVDQPVADYQVKQAGGKMKLGGKPCTVAPYGIALPKNSPLEQPMTDAVKYLIGNNSYYKNILKNWGVVGRVIERLAVKVKVTTAFRWICVA